MARVDLRTDADSEPCLEQRQAMLKAPMGLNLTGEDIVVNQLEEKAAEMLGKEAAVFTMTGIIADEMAVMSYCGKGDEVICGDKCHLITSECAASAALSGAMVHTVRNDDRGMMDPREVEASIIPAKPPSLDYAAHTKMIAIENTHNRCGGDVLTIDDQRQIVEVAHRHGVPVWCDGARFVNAAVYLGVTFGDLAKDLDSLVFGFGKCLGAYTGSVVCGPAEFVNRARRIRYMLGGSADMIGFLAAGCLWALEHSVDRVADDHANARFLAEAMANMKGLSIDLKKVQTNMVWFNVECMPNQEYVAKLKNNGILCWSLPGGIRMVTDNTIDRPDIEFTIDKMNQALKH